MKPLLLALSILSALPVLATAQPRKGTYNGLFFVPGSISPQNSGALKLTTTAHATFSGNLRLSGRRWPVSGTFDAGGGARVSIRRPNGSRLTVELQLSSDNDSLTGTVSDGIWIAGLSADRAVYGGTNSAPQAGRYTAAFPDPSPLSTEPAGTGYATIAVNSAGRVDLAGSTGDWKTISQSTTVSKAGRWPLCISLYGGRGLLLGWLSFSDDSPALIEGSVNWIRPADSQSIYPAGFTNELEVLASAYTRPAAGMPVLNLVSGQVVFEPVAPNAGFTNLILLDDRDRVRNVSSNSLSMKFALKTGSFRGKATDPASGGRFSFAGAVLQEHNVGVGCSLRSHLPGSVRLGPVIADVVEFESHGRSFAAEVQCTNAGLFRWLWSDGTSSRSVPVASKHFDSRRTRRQFLFAYPPGSLTGINIGFDAADGGESTPLRRLAQQQVRSVYFPYPLTALRYWASSYNPIATLDFTGCDSLEIIECYRCTNLQHVAVSGLPSLTRVCLEDCDLQELDLGGNPALQDVRAALNAYATIGLGGGTGPNIWHWCTRDNPQLDQSFQDVQTNFFALQELINRHDGQSGTLIPTSTVITNVETENNDYTYADFHDQTHLLKLWIFNNSLTNLVVDGCSSLEILDAHNNRLPAPALDAILAFLDTLPPEQLRVVNLSDNAEPPSAAGLGHYQSLTQKGVVVWLDAP